MNAAAIDLLDRLRSSDERTQTEAVLQLGMLLEQAIHPERRDPIWRLTLPPDLLGLNLSSQEVSEILAEALSVLRHGRLGNGNQLSLLFIQGAERGAAMKSTDVLTFCRT